VIDTILLLPDASNVALYRQATSNTNYQILIMQEGVMATACADTVHRKIRMRPHREGQYINTLSAAAENG